MKTLSIMIKPASSLCNMRCSYCFYANVSDLRSVKSHGIMSSETVDHLLEKSFADLEEGDRFHVAFQGGEPTLAGLSFFQDFIAKVRKYTDKKSVAVDYAIQTNGLSLDSGYFPFFKEHGFLVGLSIDLDKKYHDYNRIDASRKGTFSRIIATKRQLESYKIPFNVLCVLTQPLSKHPQKVWNFIQTQGFSFVQFIPCLSELEAEFGVNKLVYFSGWILDLWQNTLSFQQFWNRHPHKIHHGGDNINV